MAVRQVISFLKLLVILAVMALASGLLANYSATRVAGNARVIDGDSLFVDGLEIRLVGIDAPEYRQQCAAASGASENYACGKMALAHLKSLIASRQVSCVGHELDKYERLLAVCSTADTELNQEMVLQGWAISFGDYEREEAIARQNASGIWRGKFVSPDKWRRIDQKKHASGWLAKLFVW